MMNAYAPQRILEDDADSLSSVNKPGPAKAGLVLFPHQTPTWNRRKEILIGTDAKVNPSRTIARRASLIAKKLGPATAYYFWLVERIGTKDRTRFYIEDAAQAVGCNRRAIERYNLILVRLGFITI